MIVMEPVSFGNSLDGFIDFDFLRTAWPARNIAAGILLVDDRGGRRD